MAKCHKCGKEGETQAALGELGPSLCLPCLDEMQQGERETDLGMEDLFSRQTINEMRPW